MTNIQYIFTSQPYIVEKYSSHENYIDGMLRVELGWTADQYDLDAIADEMLVHVGAGWVEDASKDWAAVVDSHHVNPYYPEA